MSLPINIEVFLQGILIISLTNCAFQVYISDTFNAAESPFSSATYTEILDVPGSAPSQIVTHDLTQCYTGRHIVIQRQRTTPPMDFLDLREVEINTPESVFGSCSS